MSTTRIEHAAWGQVGSNLIMVPLPCPQSEVLPGIPWGHAAELFTPAFWKYQANVRQAEGQYTQHSLGRSLLEEVAVCLLGGFGMPAELGLAAFQRLRKLELLDGLASGVEIETALSEPFLISGRTRKYRFPKQKSRYVSTALAQLRETNLPMMAVPLRDMLTSLPGIGPKTASWIVRNHLGADDVAILDIHIIRAGLHLGLFGNRSNPTKHYYEMERRFLEFCEALDEPASVVDAIMWDYMRRLGPIAHFGGDLPN